MIKFNKTIILPALLFVASQINAATGVYVENKTGENIYAQIDMGNTYGWTKISPVTGNGIKKEQLPFLSSENGKRRIFWKINEDLLKDQKNKSQQRTIEKTYRTDEYSFPEKIIIKEDGNYEMQTTGLAGITGPKYTKKVMPLNKSDAENIKISNFILKIEKRLKNRSIQDLKSDIITQHKMFKQAVKNKSTEATYKLEEEFNNEFIKAANEKIFELEKQNLEIIKLEIIKDAKGLTTELPKKEATELKTLITKKDDKEIETFIRKYNLHPDYKLSTGNIIITAASNGLAKTINTLIERGSDLNAKDSIGNTALHRVVMFIKDIDAKNALEITKALLAKNPGLINVKNDNKKSSLDIVNPYKQSELKKYLENFPNTKK